MFQEELEIEFTRLGQEIKEWAKNNISKDFVFRENQLEMIHSIISNILDEEDSKPTQIIEAPTGSGKSLILIIAAGVLADVYDKSSYILCSDLSLWKQYHEFIKEHPNIDNKFGQIKGQSGNNYECGRNHHSVRYGECRMSKVSWDKLFNGFKAKQAGFQCASYCPYVKARKKAIQSKVTLMTYQLYVRTISTQSMSNEPNPYTFNRRPVIFCDECHNIPSIVQSSFGLTIKEGHVENLLALWKYAIQSNDTLFKDEQSEKLEKLAKSIVENEKGLNEMFIQKFNSFKNETDEEKSFEKMMSLHAFYMKFVPLVDDIMDMLSTAVLNKEYLSKETINVYKKAEWLKSFMNDFDTYKEIIEKTGIKYLIKTVIENLYEEDELGRKVLSKYPISLQLQCALENYMIQDYFLGSSENQVMTSATVGGHASFIENCGIGAHIYDVLPSTFDYSKSPIYYLGRWKMSNNFKKENFPKIKSAIYELCERFNDKKGIIQTWTYDNAKEIYENAPEEIQERMLLYNGSTAKQELIEYHKTINKPTILIGPTLNEGIDLPGDECRFIIMMKMPYPYIGDNLVKAKMKLFPDWYENETAKTVIQSIGRGNRYHDDWCLTYILDGCFGQLFNKTKDQFPMNIKERLKFYA